jgi:nucleoside-diphosphate-sugar epimerase
MLSLGHQVTVLNRGVTADDLPSHVERLKADRSDPQQLRDALGMRDFDLVIDTTLYNGRDAQTTVETLRNRVGRYIVISTGQVYLVRLGPERPFREEDYDGPVMPEPTGEHAHEREDWVYGVEKRAAEDVLAKAHAANGFPFVTLRLPMVNSERDHYSRIHGYVARLLDGRPIVIPDIPHPLLRHVYGEDVVEAIALATTAQGAVGRAFNISQEESLELEQFLALLASFLGVTPKLQRVPASALHSAGLMPACSPFSDPWMSALDNSRSKQELGMRYTPLATYLARLAEHCRKQSPPPGYSQRGKELAFS